MAWETEANEVFAIIDKSNLNQLEEQGAIFYQWNTPRANAGLVAQHEVLIRLVTSFATEAVSVDRFISLLE